MQAGRKTLHDEDELVGFTGNGRLSAGTIRPEKSGSSRAD